MSEIGEIKTAIDLMDSMIRSGEDHSERSLAILTEARKQLDALTTGPCDMSEELPKQIWAWKQSFITRWSSIGAGTDTVKYIRADIHEARVKELEDALSWYEQTVREFATATAQRAYQAEIALDSDRGKTARKALANQHKEGEK